MIIDAESKKLLKEAVRLADLFEDLNTKYPTQVKGGGRYVLHLVHGPSFCLNKRECKNPVRRGAEETLDFFSLVDLHTDRARAQEFVRATWLTGCSSEYFLAARKRLWQMRPLHISCFYFARSKVRRLCRAIWEWATQPADSPPDSRYTWN